MTPATNEKQNNFELEPGLVKVFQLLVAARLVLLVVGFFSRSTAYGLLFFSAEVSPQRIGFQYQRLILASAFIISITVLLLVYLSVPYFRQLSGRVFLPLALVVATLSLMLEQFLITMLRVRPLDNTLAINGTWQLMMILLVPLVLIAWQYRFRWVVFFVVASGVFQVMLMIFMAAAADQPARRFLVGNGFGLLILRSLLYLLVGYLIVQLMKHQREQRKALAKANAELARYAATLDQLATSRERNRIARELHDTLAHSLSALSVHLQAIDALWDSDPGKARTMLSDSIVATRKGLNESRRAIQALRAAPLEDLGLGLALQMLADQTAERSSITIDTHIAELPGTISPEVEQCIYRTTEESLANVVRHARATHVHVSLEHLNGRLQLTIRDNGVGFVPSAVDGREHYGLNGMRERAHLAGGQLDVQSSPGTGAVIRLVI